MASPRDNVIYRAADFGFRLDVDGDLAPVARVALAPLLQRDEAPESSDVHLIAVSSGPRGWTIAVDDTTVRASTIGTALARLMELVNRRAAASLTAEIPLHAAGVRHGNERVIALAGRSGSGKSTLGAAALLAGWGFVAEEITAVHPRTFAVRPFHRSIGLRRGGAKALGIMYPSDEAYSEVYPWQAPAATHVNGGRLIGVAIVDRTSDETRLESIRPSAALVELLEHTVVPDDDRVPEVFTQLDTLVRRLPVVRLHYRDPHGGVSLLHELLDRWP